MLERRYPPDLSSTFTLTLADGTRLTLQAADEPAAGVLGFLARAARLPCVQPGAGQSQAEDVRRLWVVTRGCAVADGRAPVCVLEPTDVQRFRGYQRDALGRRVVICEPAGEEEWLWAQLARLSAAVGCQAQARGGVLLHSGLAIYPGLGGVLLAGRSGVGKSTASRRLPPPWRALCDDVTLVVHDGGQYWAHPWPTWSRFFGPQAGDGSDTWDVERGVPLRAAFVLEQVAAGNGAGQERAERLGRAHAAGLLAERAREASSHLLRGMSPEEMSAFHRQGFDNLCALVRALPAYHLYARLDGTFWEPAGRVLGLGAGQRRTSSVPG